MAEDIWVIAILGWLTGAVLSFGLVRPAGWAMAQGTAGLIAISWALFRAIRPHSPFHSSSTPSPRVWLLLAGFGCWGLYRAWGADVPEYAWREVVHYWTYIVLWMVLLDVFQPSRHASWVAGWAGLLLVGLGAYAGYQFLTQSSTVLGLPRPKAYWDRGSATYFCPNHLAGWLETTLPVVLSMALFGRMRRGWRLLLFYAFAIGLLALLSTASRAGWLAFGVGTALWSAFLLFRFRRQRWVWVGLGTLVLLGGALLGTSEHFRQRWSGALASGQFHDVRFGYWSAAWDIGIRHPWLGVGPGHYEAWMPRYRPEWLQMEGVRCLNDYLNVFADWGLVGVLILGGALVWILIAGWKGRLRLEGLPGNRAALWLGVGGGGLNLLLHSWMDFNLYIPANAALLAFWLAVWTRLGMVDGPGARGASHSLGRLPRVLIVAVAGIGLAWNALPRWQEGRAWTQATRLGWNDAGRIEAWRRVEASSPTEESAYQLGEALRDRFVHVEAVPISELHEATEWFEKGLKRNPYSIRCAIRRGLCVHHDPDAEPEQADRWFQWAERLDPHGFKTQAYLGWHAFQSGRLEEADGHLRRSIHLRHWDNELASTYLNLVEEAMARPY